MEQTANLKQRDGHLMNTSKMSQNKMKQILSCLPLTSFKMITAFLIIFLAQFCQSECPNKFISTFYMADNRTLQNHAFKTITNPSPVICGRECSMDPKCVSFNYDTNKNFCNLNNVTRKQSLCDFKRVPGSSYYDGDSATSFSAAESVKYTSCQELLMAGHCDNGIYTIYPAGTTNGLQVYCDMRTDGGGWIVFQRRQDGSVDFYIAWDKYKHGFGNLSGEFWLGNEALRIVTQTGQWELRVDLWDWEGNTTWAEYGKFAISGEKYTLEVGLYNTGSTAGNSMGYHNARDFTTRDQDNDSYDKSCAIGWRGAWWFGHCAKSHLNGQYYHQSKVGKNYGLQWYHWKHSKYYSLKKCTMMIRPVN